MVNIEALEAASVRIGKEVEYFDMDTYGRLKTPEYEKPVGLACGTSCCLAGNEAIHQGWRLISQTDKGSPVGFNKVTKCRWVVPGKDNLRHLSDAHGLAQDTFGLSYDVAEWLFNGYFICNDTYDQPEHIEDYPDLPQITVEQTQAAIAKIIKDYKEGLLP